jgi:hypothetical protein
MVRVQFHLIRDDGIRHVVQRGRMRIYTRQGVAGEWVSKGCAGEIECSSWMGVWDIWRLIELRRKGMWAPDEVP